MEEEEISQAGSDWKSKTLLLGTIVGALVGAGAAYLIIQRAERQESDVHLTAGEGVKLGLLVFGLLRQVAQLGE
jgi:hypothetical protein